MSGFDITNVRSRSSFVASLKKRKAFGLIDSDSESEDEAKRNKNSARSTKLAHNSNSTTTTSSSSNSSSGCSSSSSSTAKTKIPNSVGTTNEKNSSNNNDIINSEEQIINSNVNPYLAETTQLDLEPISTIPKPVLLTQTSISSVINLSDNEEESSPLVDTSIDDLDPDLAALVSNPSSLREERQAQKIQLKIQYVHNIENISEKARPILDALMKPIRIYIMDNNQFHLVLDTFCKHKKLRKSDVVLTFNDDVVFLSSTPSGMNMSPIGTNNMQVYTKQCYEVLRKEKEAKKQERLKKWAETDLTTELDEPAMTDDTSAAIPESNNTTSSDEHLLLKLRGSDNKDIVLRVKKTTKLQAVITAYKERSGTNANVALSFEGEELDLNQSVEDVGLEDEDLVEVNVS